MNSRLNRVLFGASIAGCYLNDTFNFKRRINTIFSPQLARAYLDDKQYQELTTSKQHTMVYVWGEGYQVDSSQDYSNFTPKKLKDFFGEDKPDIIDMAFGWYHEAYIDKQGRLYVCAKAKMSSLKIKEVDDGVRIPMKEITTIPKSAGKVR